MPSGSDRCTIGTLWERLQTVSCLLLYGQEDYVARVSGYLTELLPKCALKKITLPLLTDVQTAVTFDFRTRENDLRQIDCKTLTIICFMSKWQNEADEYIRSVGFDDVFVYDSLLDNFLKRKFFFAYFSKRSQGFRFLLDMDDEHEPYHKSLSVYMAKSEVDKPLNHDLPQSKFVIPIQVGAALTDNRYSGITDDVGDNISLRNKRYSEMTAFYWMWKHGITDYLGLCHYRRVFVDLDKVAEKIKKVDVDAILPLPTLCEHSVFEDYMLKYIPKVWKPMMDVLMEESPEYYDAAQMIFRDRIFYASNMCILSRKVLDDISDWMFPIVAKVEETVGNIDDPYYNRYAGFCTERLITLYFLYNKHNWKIAHVEKIFID